MRRIKMCAVFAVVMLGVVQPAASEETTTVTPMAVVAIIDTGINPYSPAFRDRSAMAQEHPSTYLPGYPSDVPALHLSLDEPDLATALAKDAEVWSQVAFGQLYYIPGTKIVGVYQRGSGGTRCPRNIQGNRITFPPPAGALNVSFADCPERPILDDHGHGTSTASRATGRPASLAPDARVVMIEGLGTASSAWAASQDWIDVQSNSWGFLTGLEPGAMRAFRDMANGQLVVTASGNGLAFSGAAPTPTYAHALAAPGVVVVGGHDNGNVTAWSGAPPQVVADAFSPSTAFHDSLAEMAPDPIACCTSTATPYVAGAAAAIIIEARRLLGSDQVGIDQHGIVATGDAGGIAQGPLADGTFTIDELRTVLYRTAEARPREGIHDGDQHFLGGPAAPTYLEGNGTGENPYCQFCWTMPVAWADVPADVPAYLTIGYGAVNERSLQVALGVLSGGQAMPDRPEEDAFFAQDEDLRRSIWGAL